MAVFCQAALALRLPETPVHALCPTRLRPLPQCVASHIYVQHWLYELAHGIVTVPQGSEDAVRLCTVHRFVQTGEPFLTRLRDASSDGTAAHTPMEEDIHARRRTRVQGEERQAEVTDAAVGCVTCYVNDPTCCCGALHRTASLSASVVALCAAYVTPRPAFTPAAAAAVVSDAGTLVPTTRSQTGGSGGTALASTSAAASTRPTKPWQNYERPWRVGAAEKTSSTTAGLSKCKTAKTEVRRMGMDTQARECVFASAVRDLHTQFALSHRLVQVMRGKLAAVRSAIGAQLCAGQSIDFDRCLEQLRGMADGGGEGVVSDARTANAEASLAGAASVRNR